MIIQGKKVSLRAIEYEDLRLLHQWANDPAITVGLGDIHFPSSIRHQEKWFERIQSDNNNLRLAIQYGDNELIGYTGYWNIHWRDRRAEHALVIGNMEYHGRGLGREVILTAARYAFEELGFHRLDATIIESNAISLKCYLACGFQIEGRLREHAHRSGKRFDRIILGLLVRDYFSAISENKFWEHATEEDSDR